MTTVTISIPESLEAFVDGQFEAKGYGNVSEYICSLLREAQAKEQEQDARLEALLLEGPGSKSLPLDGDFWKHLRGGDRQAFGQETVELFIQWAAENEILIQFEHAKKGLFDIARRFRAAVNEAVKSVIATGRRGADGQSPADRAANMASERVRRIQGLLPGIVRMAPYPAWQARHRGRSPIEDVEQPDLY